MTNLILVPAFRWLLSKIIDKVEETIEKSDTKVDDEVYAEVEDLRKVALKIIDKKAVDVLHKVIG